MSPNSVNRLHQARKLLSARRLPHLTGFIFWAHMKLYLSTFKRIVLLS
jgi:hypothetical protein